MADFLRNSLGGATYETVADLLADPIEALSNATEALANATNDALPTTQVLADFGEAAKLALANVTEGLLEFDVNEMMQDVDVVLVVAYFLSSIVAFGILSSLFSALFGSSSSGNKKMRPPVGAKLKDFLKEHKKHRGPYWFLELFREQQQGVIELQIPTFARLLSGGRFYACFDVRTARKVMEDSTAIKWDKGYRFFVETASGTSIVSECLNGPRWKHVRKSTSQAFSPQNIRLVVDQIDTVANDWIEKKIKPSIESGEPLDILAEMNFVTAQVIMRAAFDYVLSEAECKEVLKSLNTCYVEFCVQSAGNILRENDFTAWMFQGIREGRKAARYLFEFSTKVLMSYRVKNEKKPHMIIDMIEEDTEYANDKEKISDVIAFMVAGFDTTANTLSLCLKELAMNTEEQDKLRSALRECKSQEEARYCPAVKNVIRETLRLHPPPANGTLRITGSEISVEGTPYVIPAKSLVMMPFYAIQRNESVFENPDEFQPSRWEEPSESMLESFIPFAIGKRACQGQAIAYAEMDTLISRVLSDFEFKVVNEGTTGCTLLHEPVDLQLSAHYAGKAAAEKSKESPDPPFGLHVLVPILSMLKGPEE